MTTYKIQPGYIVINTSKVSGGVHYDRQYAKKRREGNGHRREFVTVKRVDHTKLVEESDQLYQIARHVIRSRAANTEIGFYADEDTLRTIQIEMASLREQAEKFNRRAKRAGCARRMHVGLVPVKLEIDNVAAAQEIARTIRQTCDDFIQAIRAGDPDEITKALNRARNFEQLATGMQRDSVIWAIECAKEARSELRKVKRDGRSVKKAARTWDIEPIEACAGMFADVPSYAVDLSEEAH